jgi:hypothetical protein
MKYSLSMGVSYSLWMGGEFRCMEALELLFPYLIVELRQESSVDCIIFA